MNQTVIKCICCGTTFARLKEIADKTGAKSFAELGKHANFAQNCRRCLPYVGLMLKTGQVKFAPLNTEAGAETMPTPCSQSESFGDDDEL